MKISYLAVAILYCALPAQAQDCDQVVADQANVLQSQERDHVKAAAQKLIDQGADVRVVTVGGTSNLDIDENNWLHRCQSWQSPNGGMKSTLIVLMVSPSSRKMGIYFGHAFDSALASHWNRIKSDYMGPHFKTGDWAGGFIAAEQQLAARVAASKDEAVHPAVSTTVNQASDLSGLWTVLMWIVALGATAFGFWLIFSWRKRLRQEQQQLREAQRRAQAAKARAAELLTNMPSHPRIDAASAEFERLNSSVRNDPYADDLVVEEYNVITAQYQKVVDMLDSGPIGSEASSSVGHKRKHAHQPTSADVASSTAANASVMGGFPVPIPIIEEPIIVEEPPRYTPEPEPERHHSSRRTDTDNESSGGSSSWSSDSGSSSSDSGGSSDFSSDSGSSDSGSGGSSDF